MTEQEDSLLLNLHMAGRPAHEYGALVRGKLATRIQNTLAGTEARVVRYRTIAEVTQQHRGAQPVLLQTRPHGEFCGCDSGYEAVRS